jgi:hypothetical protein
VGFGIGGHAVLMGLYYVGGKGVNGMLGKNLGFWCVCQRT